MCGRFIVSYTYDDLVRMMSSTFNLFDLDETIDVPRYNVAPGTDVLCIINDGSKYRAGNMHWGFIPFFAKDKNIGYNMINARVEGIESKASFRESFKNKRCIILADGYYEWKKVGNKKEPYLIQQSNKEMFFFAGLWSKYTSKEGEIIFSTTIITKDASDDVKDIHHRMPVILNEKNAKEWIKTGITDPLRLHHILSQSIDQGFLTTRVSEKVNSVKNDSLECIKPYEENALF